MTELDSGPQGLRQTDARQRLAAYGANVLAPQKGRSASLAFAARFRNPLVLMLLCASAMSAVLGEVINFAIVVLIVTASVSLDFLQERRASQAAQKLQASVAVRAAVLRDGAVERLPAPDIVPGDRVQLAAGDIVPADGLLIDARDFFVQQALLSGESFPVEKRPCEAGSQATLTQASQAVFMGSSVLSGSATMLVCRTGKTTYLGEMATALQAAPLPSAFELGTQRFGRMIVNLTFALVLFVVFVLAMRQRPVQEAFLFALALAVGLTPELLPMIVSVTLARGALRMARKQVIVKRMAAIHDLGTMEVLCTDKTGTLTEARIRLERHVDMQGVASRRVLKLAFLNSHFESGLRSPMDDAILEHREVDVTGWTKIDEVPFGFERRRVSVLLERQGERLLVVKGAPEDLLPLCTQAEAGDAEGEPLLRAMDSTAHAQALASFQSLSCDGFRVLAIAWRRVPPQHSQAHLDDECGLVLSGYAAFLDPPKPSAASALHKLRGSRVRVKVLTGDNEWVTRHVCAQVGLPVSHLLTGAQIDQLDDHSLAVQAQRTDVFCRVAPRQKNRILQALRRGGRGVGFLGDGVNDALSLRDADVGITVDSAVDVAKDAADLVLLSHDLEVLHDGVIEGRRTFANVMKYLMMGTSSNVGNMLSMAAAAAFLPFLPMLPTQILLNNLLYDLALLAIPRDRVDPRELRTPHHWDTAFLRRYTLMMGPVSSLFDGLTFGVLYAAFQAEPELFRTGWFIESVATQVLVVFVIRTRLQPWRSRPDPWLAATALGVLAVAVALPYTPLAAWLGFVPPPPTLMLALAAIALVYLISAEWAKRWFYRNQRGAHARAAG
jgi:Mg2+-importing ATPase